MGILDSILGPIKDVINSLTKPVTLVKKVFGEVIDFTEETLNLIEGMIKDIENLANEHEIEGIFLYPFKDAGLKVVDSVEKIYDIIKDLKPSADGYTDLILLPLEDAYSVLKTNTKELLDKGKIILDEISVADTELISNVKNHFETMTLTLESFPQELKSLKTSIRRNFEIEEDNLFNIVPEIMANVKTEEIETEQKVTNMTQVDVESFKNVEESLKNRIANENAVLDFFYIFLFLFIIGIFFSLYFFTKSINAVKAVMFIFIFGFSMYLIHKIYENYF